MPRAPITTHRVKRYYHPLTIHARFSPERLLSPEPMSKDKVFQPEPDGCQLGRDLIVDPEPVNIPKPTGEVTRLRRDGYNLFDVLQWPKEQYHTVQRFVQLLAAKHLQHSKTFAKQDSKQLQVVYDEAKDCFPVLGRYEKDWVTADFLRVYLKNTSVRKSKAQGVSAT